MEYSLFLNNTLKVLKEKYPQENINKIIEDTLDLDKLSVYRRVKGIVQFSAIEIVKLCSKLDLSLDNIFKLTPGKTFKLTLYHNKYSENNNEQITKKTLEILKVATKDENSKIIIGTTTLIPEALALHYKNISYAQRCIWNYCNDVDHSQIKIANIEIPIHLTPILKEYINLIESFATTVFILYEDLFRLFFSNILFLYEIKIITKEEIENIRKEMKIFLQDLEQLAQRGYWKNSNQDVNIFISSFIINNDYAFIESEDIKLILFNAFNMNFISTTDTTTFEQVKLWIKIITKSSTLISGSGMKARIEFFDQQYKYLDMLNI